MKVETEVELYMDCDQKYMLWGIFHHHIMEEQLDAHEIKFRQDLLAVLDPYKDYEEKYLEIQNRTV